MISDAAFAILTAFREGKCKLTRKAGNFLGECVVDPQPLTDRQSEWLATLAARAGVGCDIAALAESREAA